MKRIVLGLCTLLIASPAFSEPHWQTGNINNMTSGAGWLYIMLDTGLPDNCVGASFGWMKIAESSKAMIAVTLLAKIQNRPVTVYTEGRDASGYCVINQVHPYL